MNPKPPITNAMLGNWEVGVEVFGVVSGQVDDKEGANVLNVRIWVEGAVLEYEPCCVAKPPGKFRLRIGTQGRGADADTKENPALET